MLSQKRVLDRHGAPADCLESAYLEFCATRLLPTVPVLIPVPNHLGLAERLLAACPPDLVVLTGGNSVDPEVWGSAEQVDDLAPERDEVEGLLVDAALEAGAPILGLCRGAQFLNVHLGGRLRLNLKDHPPAVPHACSYEGRQYTVNSYHEHGIPTDGLAPGLMACATSEGGIVEAYADPDRRLLGLQWHPERPGADPALFVALARQLRIGQ